MAREKKRKKTKETYIRITSQLPSKEELNKSQSLNSQLFSKTRSILKFPDWLNQITQSNEEERRVLCVFFTWTMPRKELDQPYLAARGTIATDITTLSALQRHITNAVSATTLNLSGRPIPTPTAAARSSAADPIDLRPNGMLLSIPSAVHRTTADPLLSPATRTRPNPNWFPHLVLKILDWKTEWVFENLIRLGWVVEKPDG